MQLKMMMTRMMNIYTGNDLKQSTPAVCGFKSSPV